MKKLKLQQNKECFFCWKREGLHLHEVFFGSADRKKSIEYGCQVYLCPEHHNMSNKGVHLNRKMDLILKKYCQKEFERVHSHEEFMDVFHRNYLEDEYE